MKSIRSLLRVVCLLSFACRGVAEAQVPPVRIMPLGDSLTSGTTVEGAYRNSLYPLLTAAGYNVDFIGTRTDLINPTLPDRNHQGMGGFRIDQIQAGLGGWLDAIEDPDVVLLMIGTNDFSANFNVDSAQIRLANLVTDIATKRPFAKIIVSNLPVRTDDPAREALQANFNSAIPGIVSSQVALGRQVTLLDMHSVLTASDLSEGVHPTPAGNTKMANAWFPAISSVISPLGTANPPAIIRAEPATDLQHIALKFSKPLADSAASLANFSVSGGLAITQAVLDPVTKRTITLTTASQAPGTLYTVTVSGVRDRTPQQTLIAAGSTVSYSSFTLANGSFEAGEVGWSMSGNRLVYAADATYTATHGLKLLVLNGGQTPPTAVVAQTFGTKPGQRYVLEFDLGLLALNFAGQQLGVEVKGAATLVSLTQSVTGNGQGNSVWTAFSYPFTADSAATTLTFRDLSATTIGLDLLLDRVRVTAVPIAVNTAPVAAADSFSTVAGSPLVVPAAGVLLNDTDAQSNPLTAVLNAAPGHGSVVLNANGGFTYTPAAGYSGADAFTYHANDGLLDSTVVAVSVAVIPASSGPLVNGSFEAGETGWTMTGNRLVNTSDLSYVATDGSKLLIMNGGQTPPNAVISQAFTTTPGQGYVVEFDVGTLAFNFSGQQLGVELKGAATLLSVTDSVFGNGLGNSSWTAKSHGFVADSTSTTLTFRDLSASTNNLDLLLDRVRVTANLPVNTAPVANADAYVTNQGTALVVPAAGVLGNDTDAQSNPLTATLVAAPVHGSVTVNANGGFTYTPAAGYSGPDSFTYHANDGLLDSNVANVVITVNPSAAPVLANGGFESGFAGWTTAGNVSIEFYQPTDGIREAAFNSQNLAPNGVIYQTLATVPGQTYSLTFDMGVLSYVARQLKLGVTVTGSGVLLSEMVAIQGEGNGTIQWVPQIYSFVANSASSILTFRDRSNTTEGLDLLLDNVRVIGVPPIPNTAPVAAGDSYSTPKNTTLVIPPAGVLANDSDPQSNPLTASLDVGPAHGGVILNADGGFVFTPATGYTGPDSFTYHARDGSLDSNIVTVTLAITPVDPGLLINPSFESDFTAWTMTGNQSIEFYPATEGNRLVAFNSLNRTPNAVLSQTFATTAGRTYSLAFDLSILSYVSDSQTLQATVTGSGSLLARTVTIAGTGAGLGPWTTQNFTFVANSPSTTLTFRDQSSATTGVDLLLDNVRVLAVATQSSASAASESLGAPTLCCTPEAAVIRMSAVQAGNYVLERSADLKHWEAVDSMDCQANDPVVFYDCHDPLGIEPTRTQMFYRIAFRPEALAE